MKKRQACKPGSVTGFPVSCHLSGICIAADFYRPTPRQETSHFNDAGIFDLSTPDAYPSVQLPSQHFFTCITFEKMIVILCGALLSFDNPPVRRRGALCCPDFPPRLNEATRRLAQNKINI